MRKLLLTALFALAACTSSSPAESRFEPGQVWSVRTSAPEAASTLTVLKVERHPHAGTVVHTRVRHPRMTGDVPEAGAYFVFSAEAVERSVAALVRTEATAPYLGPEYAAWKREPAYFSSTVDATVVTQEQAKAIAARRAAK